jgi:hypothetical protein
VGATEGRRLVTSSLKAVNFFNVLKKDAAGTQRFKKFYTLKYIQLTELALISPGELNILRKRLFHISRELIFAAYFAHPP